jgi:hypothetical protein
MKRREFVTLVCGAAAVWPIVTRAQQPARLPTIGFLGPGTPAGMNEWVAAFVQRLSELHRVVGNTVAIEYRWSEGRVLMSERGAFMEPTARPNAKIGIITQNDDAGRDYCFVSMTLNGFAVPAPDDGVAAR